MRVKEYKARAKAMGFNGRAGFGGTGRIDQWNAGSGALAEDAIAGGGLPLQRQAQDLSFRDGLDPDWSEALEIRQS